MLAVLAPGQGSQKPGFLTPWLGLDDNEALLCSWSDIAGLDLVHLGTKADADEIKDTAKTQPLLVAAALLTAANLPMDDVALVAGHSVGELGAAAMAGVLSPADAIALAAERGRQMAAACAATPTSMCAVLGGVQDEVLAAIESVGLYPANRNGAGQIVAAGSVEGIDKLESSPPARARVIRLQVAGAFHTPYMAPAEEALTTFASDLSTATPNKILLSNRDGSAVEDGAELLRRLVAQVTAPVRWDLCMERMIQLGVTTVIELAPAGTLAGLAKRGLKGVKVLTVNTPDDLAAAREAIAAEKA